MEDVWNNTSRLSAIYSALERMQHDQTAIGLGFRLRHDPTKCARCKATIATLELSALITHLETKDQEEETVDV